MCYFFPSMNLGLSLLFPGGGTYCCNPLSAASAAAHRFWCVLLWLSLVSRNFRYPFEFPCLPIGDFKSLWFCCHAFLRFPPLLWFQCTVVWEDGRPSFSCVLRSVCPEASACWRGDCTLPPLMTHATGPLRCSAVALVLDVHWGKWGAAVPHCCWLRSVPPCWVHTLHILA